MGKKSKKHLSNKGGGKKGKRHHGAADSVQKGPSAADADACDEEWEFWDDFLTGREDGRYRDYDEFDEDVDITSRYTGHDGIVSPKLPKKGSIEALRAALENLWSNPNISNPHNIGVALGPTTYWMVFAMDCSDFPASTSKFTRQYNEDKSRHKAILEKLAREKDGAGFSGSIDYILALNCIFHDTFDALDLEHPPSLNLAQGLSMLRRKGMSPNQSMMRIWQGYETRTLEIIRVVNENPLSPIPDTSDLAPCSNIPIKVRGKFPLSHARKYNPVVEQIEKQLIEENCEQETNIYNPIYPRLSNFYRSRYSEEEVEELFCQGVMPWDDDAELVLQALQNCDI